MENKGVCEGGRRERRECASVSDKKTLPHNNTTHTILVNLYAVVMWGFFNRDPMHATWTVTIESVSQIQNNHVYLRAANWFFPFLHPFMLDPFFPPASLYATWMRANSSKTPCS